MSPLFTGTIEHVRTCKWPGCQVVGSADSVRTIASLCGNLVTDLCPRHRSQYHGTSKVRRGDIKIMWRYSAHGGPDGPRAPRQAVRRDEVRACDYDACRGLGLYRVYRLDPYMEAQLCSHHEAANTHGMDRPWVFESVTWHHRNGHTVTFNQQERATMTTKDNLVSAMEQAERGHALYMAEMARKLDAVAALGEDDDYELGAIMVFDKTFVDGRRTYKYTAMKCEGGWYTSGPRSPGPYSWSGLVEFLSTGVPEVWMVDTLRQIR